MMVNISSCSNTVNMLLIIVTINGYYMVNILLIIIWLVVSTYPSEKSWSESHLGWWNSQLNGKIKLMFQTTSQLLITINDYESPWVYQITIGLFLLSYCFSAYWVHVCPTFFFLYWVYHTTMKIAMNHYQSLVITITPRKNAIPKHQRTRLWRPWSILICAALRQGWKGCPCPQLGGVSMNRTCTIYIYICIHMYTHIKCIYIHTIYIYMHT